jgi:hypothetical protein
MRKYLAPFGAASLVSLAFVCCAWAAGVNSADLSGRRICWDSGQSSSYGPGGKYSSSFSGEGTWAIAGGGVHIHTARYDYMATMQKRPDGTFHAVIIGAGISSNGKYCD